MNTIIDMLQDVSFKNSYFMQIIKYAYITSMTLCSLAGLMFITFAFSRGIGFGIFSLLLTPIAVLLAIGFVRLAIETLLSIMRASKYVREIARQGRNLDFPVDTHGGTNSNPDHYRQTGF